MLAGKRVGDVAAYQQQIIERLDRKPALVGHSFGGLLVQILAGRGLSAVTVAIDPAPTRGVLPSSDRGAQGQLAGRCRQPDATGTRR